MFSINVWLTVQKPEDIAAVEGLLGQACRLSRTEPGCLRFDVYHSQADAAKFLLVEHWSDQAAWEAHRLEKAYLEIYKPQVMPLVVREGHISTLLVE